MVLCYSGFFPTSSSSSSGSNDGSGGDISGGNTSGDGWDDEHSNTLWGWLDGLFSGIKSVWQAITDLPSLIGNALKGFFDNVVSAITSLPNAIINGIKAIFIPDTDYIESSFNSFTQELKLKFNFDTEFFENLFQSESPVTDVYVDYDVPYVGKFKFKVLDADFLVTGITYFRPFIRGFLVLLMALYNIKQLIGFFGYDAGVVAGRSEWVAYNKADTKK